MATKLRKAKKVLEEKRIYVIVPMTVTPEFGRLEGKRISMEPGRLMAQCAHVVSRMRGELYLKTKDPAIFNATTTIVLSVRNSRELRKIHTALSARQLTIDGKNGFDTFDFCDTNPSLYGTSRGIQTAVCTSPVRKSFIDEEMGHLELYV